MEKTDKLKAQTWRAIMGTDAVPADENEYLKALYGSSLIGGQKELSNSNDLIREILSAIGEEPGEDLAEFWNENSPTIFFYETLLAYEDLRKGREPTEAEGDAGASDEDDVSDDTPVTAHAKTMGVDLIKSLVQHGQIDLEPPWQRTVVWSPAKQRELIKSLLLGIPIPSIILHSLNPGGMEDRYAIIDGKQRLTAICNFIENKYKLPPFKVDPGHALYDCRGRWFDNPNPRVKNLSAGYRNRIIGTQIPVLLFENISEKRLRQVFHLYNVTATRLNPAEIRNAVYQTNKIHQTLFILAGEKYEASPPPPLDAESHEKFKQSLRTILPTLNRFAAVEFLCRYLGYSRAPVAPTSADFNALGTNTAICRYFDYVSANDSPEDIVREIVLVLDRVQDYFNWDDDGGDDGHSAFYVLNEQGQRRFQALQAITSMVCTKLLVKVEELGAASTDAVRAAVREVVREVEYPGKQQVKIIWDHQACRFLGLVDKLGLDLSSFDNGTFKSFADRMAQVRLEKKS